jgi:hypothetical protein
MSAQSRSSKFPPSVEEAHRARLVEGIDPRARALLEALEQWLPPRLAWDRAVSIASPLLLLASASPGTVSPDAIDPARVITEALSDRVAMKGLPASPERIAQAIAAWNDPTRPSQLRLRRIVP